MSDHGCGKNTEQVNKLIDLNKELMGPANKIITEDGGLLALEAFLFVSAGIALQGDIDEQNFVDRARYLYALNKWIWDKQEDKPTLRLVGDDDDG